LALSPLAPSPDALVLVLTATASAVALGAVRPRETRFGSAALWIACVALAGALAGLGIGSARLAAIDDGAVTGAVGDQVTVRGWITTFPRRSQGRVDVVVETQAGRLMVEAVEPVPDLKMGAGLEATGTIRAPPDWQRDLFARLGVARVLVASELRTLARDRGGVAGAVDSIRRRAEDALASGTPEAPANLLRGFVLGEDDRIDDATRDRFKRSGLAHLLAVSGQNVVLLAILGAAVCALAGVSLRARLLVVLVLIAVYVPLTGGGASIQRAGVMGAAGVVAALASRPASRW
jgi:competence protein ComEC